MEFSALIDVDQFKNLIIVPTLKAVDLYSEAAVNLLLGTAIQESRLTYLKQKGGGPALGLFQIEPATLKDVYDRYLHLERKKELLGRVQQFVTAQDIHEQVISNIPFAVVIARVRYFMVPKALPAYADVQGLGEYWKEFYNTEGGSGEVHEFVANYNYYALKLRPDK